MRNIMVRPRLNEILKERGMTQNDLAELTGITQPVISRFDKNSQHRSVYLYLIAKALDIKIDDLFEIQDFDNPDFKPSDFRIYSTKKNDPND